MAKKFHPSAVIHPEAKIHESCEIGPFCVIDKGAKIGPNNIFHSHVHVSNNTTIGESNQFFSFSVIGGAPQDLKYKGEDTQLIIGNHNTIRECATLNIGTVGGGNVTKIGDHNLLMAYVHVAHDVIIANHTIIGNSCQIAGHVSIEDYATIGGLSAVAQFIRIGQHCYIGGASGADRDVPPFSLGRGISQEFDVWGMNIVGLKRRGFSAEAISALQDASRIFKDKNFEKETALQMIEQKYPNISEVKYFVDFARKSQKGIYR